MAKDIQDRVGQFLGSDGGKQLVGTAVTELLGGLSSGSNKTKGLGQNHDGNGGALSGAKGLAAGAGAAALAPVAVKGIGKLIRGGGSLTSGPKDLADGAVSKLGDSVGDMVKGKVDEAGGPSGILKDTVKSALPFGGGGGGGGGGKNDAEGVGKGRRMPVQQYYDIGLPIETVYNQWTQFEEWPKFMHRVTRASQEDPCKVNFAVKIWGKTKEFTAEIETQRPNDRIKWKTTEGMNHTGVVLFRELAPNLTRVLLSFDIAPGSLLEKYARGTRYVKRAARADLHRFVAFIEMLENETGAWRGVIEDGELVEDHDPSYDEKREYGSADELVHGRGSDEKDSEEDEDEDEESDQRGQKRSRGNGGDPEKRGSRTGRGRSTSAQRKSSGSRQGSAPSRRASSSRSTSGSGSGRRTRSSSGGRSKDSSSSGRSSSGRSSGGSSSGRSSSGRSSSRSSSGGSSSSRSKSGASGSSRGSSSGRQRSRPSGSR